MGTGVITNEFLDDFPKIAGIRGGNRGRQTTDADIALEKLAADGAPSRVLKFIDYTVTVDENGVTTDVAPEVAGKRAGARAMQLKQRGYDVESGWMIVSRGGCVYAKFYGPGNVPVKESKGAPVGEAVPV